MTTKRLIARAKEGFTHFIDCAEWLCLAYQQKDENLKPHEELVKKKFYQLLVRSGRFKTASENELPIVEIGEKSSNKLFDVVNKYGFDNCSSFFKATCADFDIRLIEFVA